MPANSDAAALDDDLDERFRALSPWLLRTLARRYGLAHSDAEDMVQESFLRLARYGIGDRSRHPRALLLRIAANLTADARRRLFARGGDRHVALADLPSPPPSLVCLSDQDFLVDLKSAILDLPEPLRETFLLARFTPLTQAEIAARLGISTKTVEWRISKAIAVCLARLGH